MDPLVLQLLKVVSSSGVTHLANRCILPSTSAGIIQYHIFFSVTCNRWLALEWHRTGMEGAPQYIPNEWLQHDLFYCTSGGFRKNITASTGSPAYLARRASASFCPYFREQIFCIIDLFWRKLDANAILISARTNSCIVISTRGFNSGAICSQVFFLWRMKYWNCWVASCRKTDWLNVSKFYQTKEWKRYRKLKVEI